MEAVWSLLYGYELSTPFCSCRDVHLLAQCSIESACGRAWPMDQDPWESWEKTILDCARCNARRRTCGRGQKQCHAGVQQGRARYKASPDDEAVPRTRYVVLRTFISYNASMAELQVVQAKKTTKYKTEARPGTPWANAGNSGKRE